MYYILPYYSVVSTNTSLSLDNDYIKKGNRQDDFIKSCLKELGMPFSWELMTYGHYITELAQYSVEYQIAANRFMKMRSSFHITNIQKIENPFLLINYHLMKSKYIKEHGRVSEMALFHGTRTTNLKSICTNNFDWRLTGK